MVRAARRRAGLSQREIARRAGVAAGTVTAVEAGRQVPSGRVLEALVAAAGLELSVDRPVQALCAHTRRHLHHSLSVRLHLALGGNGHPYDRPFLPAWQQLGLLSGKGVVHVTGELARALWLPAMSPPEPVVGVDVRRAVLVPPAPDLRVQLGPAPSTCTITVPLTVGRIVTPSPDELALDPQHAAWRRALRSVSHELERQAPLDRARRRRPAHREPRRLDESTRLLFARRWTARFLPPDAHDVRGWRLGDVVGMDQWIEQRSRRY
jgi:transcriptional regulator with XRE-family HTH domain